MSMTVFMVTHDINEAFRLGTRLLVFDKVRHDEHAPEAYGATITYDLPLKTKADRMTASAELSGLAQT
jgi:NitT/TauT family transport system ATP-binding protein